MRRVPVYDRGEAPLRAIRLALRAGKLGADNPCALLLDVPRLKATVASLLKAMPPAQGFTHCFAVKSNPLAAVVRLTRECGMGAECASFAEVVHSLRNGHAPENVVFDSPCKTEKEVLDCLAAGVNLNLDSLAELEAFAPAIKRFFRGLGGGSGGGGEASAASVVTDAAASAAKVARRPVVGLRINPQLGAGDIASTSTATKTSKFGIPLSESRELVLEAFREHAWLAGLHCHVGSQGCAPEMAVRGAAALAKLAAEIEALLPGRVRIVNIGGGLPIDYNCGDGDGASWSFARYAAALREAAPGLLLADETTGRRRHGWEVRTEFGRKIVQKCGFIAARVENTKSAGGRLIATW